MAKIFHWLHQNGSAFSKNEIPESELAEVVDALKNGGIIIFPTDTVYGIGCNCFDETAIHRIYELKHRPLTKPTNILSNSIEKLTPAIQPLSPVEQSLVTKYLPGALTLIADKTDQVPNCVTAGLPTVGIRIPDNEIALRILESVDFPVATTSVNLAGDTPGLEIDDFLKTFEDKVDIIIDGGPTKLRIPSTIIRVQDEKIQILRQGSVSL